MYTTIKVLNFTYEVYITFLSSSTNNIRKHQTLFSLKLTTKWRMFLLVLTALALASLYILWCSSTSYYTSLRPQTLLIHNNKHLCSIDTSLVHRHRRQSPGNSTTPSEISIVIVVPSGRSNFVQRNLIRQTYGSIRNMNNVHILAVVFIVGSADDPSGSKTDSDGLDAERILFGNIIVGDLLDSYRNLSRKSIMTYDWLTSYCNEAGLVVKTDDDVVVHIFKLTEELGTFPPDATESSNFWCGVHQLEAIDRNPESKYYVSPEEYAGEHLPQHCAGVSYVTTMRVVHRISDEISKSFQGAICSHEDVFLTGIVPERINSREHESSIVLVDKRLDWVLYVDDNSPLPGAQYIWNVVAEALNETADFEKFRNESAKRVFYLIQHDSYFENHVSLGGLGDSFYEYLLKSWIQSNKTDSMARVMYDDAMTAVIDNKLIQTSPGGLIYTSDMRFGHLNYKMGHLACFAGGMFALGASMQNDQSTDNDNHMKIGEGITNTCHESYIRTPTHLGPEEFGFYWDMEATSGLLYDQRYTLRPEVFESYFILWRLTHDQKYRDWGWDAVQALERYCRTTGGYSGISNVNSQNPAHDDVQQSFFLAESLKYLYLLYSDDSLLPLDEWVFNTEAHPLPVNGTRSYRMYEQY